ncbi:MAG: DUF1211 domain-containing protein [Pleurocapsa sp. SU_196_0]|nr:DUF1211 domain-containing protein [Pleurocapsa sp. SU_196_0]
MLAYVLSFVHVGIYWNNHHHLLHAAHRVDGRVMWANLHLLFWLSLIPFVTAWMGENVCTTSQGFEAGGDRYKGSKGLVQPYGHIPRVPHCRRDSV